MSHDGPTDSPTSQTVVEPHINTGAAEVISGGESQGGVQPLAPDAVSAVQAAEAAASTATTETSTSSSPVASATTSPVVETPTEPIATAPDSPVLVGTPESTVTALPAGDAAAVSAMASESPAPVDTIPSVTVPSSSAATEHAPAASEEPRKKPVLNPNVDDQSLRAVGQYRFRSRNGNGRPGCRSGGSDRVDHLQRTSWPDRVATQADVAGRRT